jgi:hypothetical protein
MSRIVWIASYPKSGNTWTRAFLHNLFLNAEKPYDINKMDALNSNEAAVPNFGVVDDRPWQDWTPDDVAAARPKVQLEIAMARPHNVFCKTHLAVLNVRGHPTINLDVTAGAIYLVRNPLDIAPSLKDHQGLPMFKIIEMMNTVNFETPTTEKMVGEPWGNWSQNVESWTAKPNPALHVMRYESMLADPLKAFTDLVRFLNIDTTKQRIRKAVEHSSFETLRRMEERDGFWERTIAQKKFFRRGQAGGWRDELTDEEAHAIVDTHRAQMERFGYVPEGF